MSIDQRVPAFDRLGAEAVHPPSSDAGSTELEGLERRSRLQKLSLEKLFAEQEHRLKQKYADWIIWLLGGQFVIADLVFVAFAWVGLGWDLPPGVVEVWLAATVVQVVGWSRS
jgi:glutathione S-transferase